LEPLFWLQSMSTFPSRSVLVIRDTASPGRSASMRCANARASSLACSAVRPAIAA